MSASISVVIYMKDSEENSRTALTIIASLQEKFYANIFYISTDMYMYLDKSARKQVANLTSLKRIYYIFGVL